MLLTLACSRTERTSVPSCAADCLLTQKQPRRPPSNQLPSRRLLPTCCLILRAAGIKGRFVKAEELDAYKAGLLPGQNGRPPC